MGKTVTSMEKSELYSSLVDKIADYQQIMLADDSISISSVDKRMKFITKDLKEMVEEYYELRKSDKKTYESEAELSSLESKIQSLMDDEYKFLDFFTKSLDKKTSGIEYYDGDRKLFNGINKQVSERVIKTLQFKKDILGEPFDVDEIGNEDMYIQSKDSVAIDLNNLVPNLFHLYFFGDGEGFYQSLRDRGLTKKDITAFSGVIDLSEQKNENFHSVYDTIIKKASKGQSIELPQEEVAEVKKAAKHF